MDGRSLARLCPADVLRPIKTSLHCDLALQVPDPKLKYQQLLAYGKKLPKMAQEDHTDENKVRGCVSQVGCSLAVGKQGLFCTSALLIA